MLQNNKQTSKKQITIFPNNYNQFQPKTYQNVAAVRANEGCEDGGKDTHHKTGAHEGKRHAQDASA